MESTDKFIEDKHGDFTELTELLLALSRCLTYRYAGVSLGWYMHMLIKHIEYLILQHKGLKKYCNEGSESLNALCMLIKDRSSNCGGGKGKVSLLEQILLLILRRLYIYVNSDWKDVAWIGASSESFSQLFEEDSDDTDIGSQQQSYSEWYTKDIREHVKKISVADEAESKEYLKNEFGEVIAEKDKVIYFQKRSQP